MITDTNFRSEIGPELRRQNLADYWNEFFVFSSDTRGLHLISERALRREIDAAKSMDRPYLDAQQAINRVLTELGAKHNFQRQFSEQFPEFRREQVLGMQLYRLVTGDDDWWVYTETQHANHTFPHAVYFAPRASAEYQAFVARHG
ncbi:hypothetical protein [Thiohalomonas denitrificans]|uniref:Uncharacterized protein n=1 Tax=Thiohalomonas denitrificans TaxID=415747 RepID=A0A1G5R0V0_9GAMM|nr:hypothetical protein [Thiohalomonas denitrificans]SCZ67617.1 hypothetical protein SAMN03097708_03176 [Thiohalomonas denitrificans]